MSSINSINYILKPSLNKFEKQLKEIKLKNEQLKKKIEKKEKQKKNNEEEEKVVRAHDINKNNQNSKNNMNANNSMNDRAYKKEARSEDQLKDLEEHLNSINRKLKEDITKQQRIKIIKSKAQIVLFCLLLSI